MADRTVQYYYQKAAWEAAFKGTDHKIVIAQSGAVYRNSLSPENLVIDEIGNVGSAGILSPGALSIQVNTKEATGNTSAASIRFHTPTYKVDLKGGIIKTLNEWGFIALVIDNKNSRARLYADEEMVDEKDLPEQFTFNRNNIETLLGASDKSFLSSYDLTGSIDDFRLYDDVISNPAYYFEITASQITMSGDLIEIASEAEFNKLENGMYLDAGNIDGEPIFQPETYIQEKFTGGDFIVRVSNDILLDATNRTLKVYAIPPEIQAIQDIYNYGRQNLNFDEKIFIPPKNVSKGRTASFKISTTRPMNIRGVAIEYQDGAIR